MAKRTTEARVRSANPKILSTFNLDLAIDTASSLVDEAVACASAKGVNVSDQRWELIETWLAAHFAYISTPTNLQSKSIGGASQSYVQGAVGTGLEASPYGIQALRLDTSGCLESLTGETVQFNWIGNDDDNYDTDWNV